MEKINKITALILLIGPIIYSYFFPLTNVHCDTVLFLISGLWLYFINKKKCIRHKSPKFFTIYVAYACIVPIFGFFIFNNISGYISSCITILIFSLFFTNAIPHVDINIIKKYYKTIVYITCAIFIMQEIMYYTLGWRISGLIPFLDVAYSYTDTSAFIQKQMHFDRSSSIFLEPAHFAQYVAGYIAISLGEKAEEGSLKIKEPLILSMIMLLTWSGNCILALVCIWTIFLSTIKLKKTFKLFVLLPSVIIVCITICIYLMGTEKGEKLLDREKEIETEQTYVSSGMMRIYRGYFVQSAMPNSLKTSGVGTGYIPSIIDHNKYSFMFHDFEYYVNNVQTLLIGNGYLGTLIFCLFLINLSVRRSRVALIMIGLFIAFSFVESFWCTAKMTLYLTIAAAAFKNKYANKKLIEHSN